MVMIYTVDDFIDEQLVQSINSDPEPFQEFKTPDKSFWCKIPSEQFVGYIKEKIEQVEGNEIEVVFSFFREANKGQDNELRIHNDSIINGQQPDRAGVLYLSNEDEAMLNGTAFWKHKKHGYKFDSLNEKEFNRLLLEDSNDQEKWTLNSVIGHKQNRFLSYPCSYFHSKYPKEFNNSRVVFVIFYKVIK